MSESEPEAREILKRWSAGSLALFVLGSEILVFAFLLLQPGRGPPLFLGATIVVGILLVVGGLLTRRRRDAVMQRWTEGSAASFVIGLLILAPSGLCTGWGGFYAITSIDGVRPTTQRARESQLIMAQVIPQVLIIGGVSMVIGGAFVLAGLKTRRRD